MTVEDRCASNVQLHRYVQSGLWFPDIRFVFDTTLASLESTCIAEASSANTRHNVATLTAGNDDMAIGARTCVGSQPLHEAIIPFDNVFQVLQVVCEQVLLMATEHLRSEKLSEILFPQPVLAACCWTSDVQFLLVNSRFGPLLSTRSTESMATCVITPMLVFAQGSTPKIAINVTTIIRHLQHGVHANATCELGRSRNVLAECSEGI